MFAGMSYVLEEALVDVYAERGWPVRDEGMDATSQCHGTLERGALMPDLRTLHDRVEQVLQRKGYGQEIQSNMGAALRSRLNSLLMGQKGALLDTRHSTPAELLFSRPAVIELHQLGDDEEKSFVMALLFVLLCEHAEVRQQELSPSQRGQLQHLTLIEEAHRLLAAPRGSVGAEGADARGKAVQMFTDLLAEMRAYGEGFIVADQIPTKLAPEILKNTALKITHRLASPDDRQAIGGACNLSLEQISALNLLTPGQAVVHDADIGQAVRVQVRAPEPTAADVAAVSSKARDLTWLRFGGGCEPCTEPCRWRRALPGSELAIGVNFALDGLVRALLDPACALPEIDLRVAAEDSPDRTHCAALFSIRRQLEIWLTARHVALGGQSLRVIDRIHIERCLSQAGQQLRRWSAGDAVPAAAWQPVRVSWRALIATSPPRSRVGCRQCPSPCAALYEVATWLPQVPAGLRALVDGVQPAALRIESFEKGTAKFGDMSGRDAQQTRVLRYCLAVVCAGERPTESAKALIRELAAQ